MYACAKTNLFAQQPICTCATTNLCVQQPHAQSVVVSRWHRIPLQLEGVEAALAALAAGGPAAAAVAREDAMRAACIEKVWVVKVWPNPALLWLWLNGSLLTNKCAHQHLWKTGWGDKWMDGQEGRVVLLGGQRLERASVPCQPSVQLVAAFGKADAGVTVSGGLECGAKSDSVRRVGMWCEERRAFGSLQPAACACARVQNVAPT
eukprot:365372-Chlamydomonas_euryale.AAC.6